jgi:hypothetical protein
MEALEQSIRDFAENPSEDVSTEDVRQSTLHLIGTQWWDHNSRSMWNTQSVPPIYIASDGAQNEHICARVQKCIFPLVVALMFGKERRGFLFLVYDVVRLFLSLGAANNNDPTVMGPSSPTEVFQLIVTMALGTAVEEL